MTFHYPGVLEDETEREKHTVPDLNVGFLLMQDFTLMPVAGFVESLRFAADRSFRSQQLFCRWSWISEEKSAVKASCGMEIHPQHGLDRPEQYDYIAVTGGLLGTVTSPSPAIIDFLKRAHEVGVKLIGLCSGSFILAEAGLLDRRKCALHFTIWEYFKQRYPNTQAVIDRGHIRDGDVITCPGGTAIELAAELITEHCGRSRALKGLDYLLVNRDDEGDQKEEVFELVCHENNLLERSVLLMQENLSTPYPIKNLAEQLNTTERQLTRLFSTYLKSSPAAYWRKLRLEHARGLLLNTTKMITEIAYETGFSDASHFTLWYKKIYGEAPARFRRRRNEINH